MFSARFFSGALEKSGVHVNFTLTDAEGHDKSHVVTFQWLESEDVENVVQRFGAYVQQALDGRADLGSVRTNLRVDRLSSNADSPDHEILMQLLNIIRRYRLEGMVCSGAGSYLFSAHGLISMAPLLRLDISSCGLAELPTGVCELIKLTNLNVSRNRLAALPQAISQLSSLQVLCANDNALTTLPGGHLLGGRFQAVARGQNDRLRS
jgi:hypothetical protein